MGDMIQLLSLVALALGLWGLVALIFRRGSRRAGLVMIIGAVALIGHAAALSDREAQQQGFQSIADRKAAFAIGVENPKEWAKRRASIEADQERQARVAERIALEERARAGGFKAVDELLAAKTAGFTTQAAYANHLAREAFFALPKDQQSVVTAVETARQAYHSADNDLQRGSARAKRRQEMCRVLGRRRASNWVGTLTLLTTNTEGHGVVSIAIANDVSVKTWNNSLSDVFHKTLLNPSSKVFHTLSNLKVGDRVKFSGRFFKGKADCIHEASLTLRGAMLDPEFIIRLTDVRVPDGRE